MITKLFKMLMAPLNLRDDNYLERKYLDKVQKMPNILYVIHKNYDACVNLDNATSLQRLSDRIIVHFQHPEESFTVFEDSEEFAIIDDYFECLKRDRIRLNSFINREKHA
jgi:hypothetical protein